MRRSSRGPNRPSSSGFPPPLRWAVLLLLILALAILSSLPKAESPPTGNATAVRPLATPAQTPLASRASGAGTPSATRIATRQTHAVAGVIDGDTLKASVNGTIEIVRIVGIDTPEVAGPYRSAECFGAEASARARQLLDGQRVGLTRDPSQDDRDQYGRLLRAVTLSDTADFGLRMISEGYAREFTYAAPHANQRAYRAAESTARLAGVGLWAPVPCGGAAP